MRLFNIKINSFELKSLSLRSYSHVHILAFGDLLHRIHPLAGQGFNMTIRDVKILLEIIISKQSLGLNLDSSVNYDFENKLKHKNFINSSNKRFEKLNQRYIKTVKSYVSDILIDKFWSIEVDNLISKQLKLEFNKRLSHF